MPAVIDGRSIDDVALLAPCRDEAHELEIDGHKLRNGQGVKSKDCEGESLGGGLARVAIMVAGIAEGVEVVPRFVRDDAGEADQIGPCLGGRIQNNVAGLVQAMLSSVLRWYSGS